MAASKKPKKAKLKTHDIIVRVAGNNPDCVHYETITEDSETGVLLGVCSKCHQVREYKPIAPDKQKYVFRIDSNATRKPKHDEFDALLAEDYGGE